MPIALVAHAEQGSSNGTSATTSAIDTTGATLLVIWVAYTTSPGTISDSKSNTWTPLTERGAGPNGKFYYCKNPTVGTGHTFSITGSTVPTIFAAAFSGTDTSANADVENGAADSNTTVNTGSITPSVDNCLVITGMQGISATSSVGSGFTAIGNIALAGGQHYQANLAYEIQTTAAAVNPQWTQGTSGAIAAGIAVFKPYIPPPPPPPSPITYGSGYIDVDLVDPGVSYEIFQMCLGREPAESISFALYESQLGEGGFETSTLYGPNTGRKRWKLGFPTLSGASADKTVTGSDGGLMTAAGYLWDFYCRARRTGKPFVITSPRNGQYYLVKFANPSLDFNRMFTQLYSTGVELRQVRVPGVTVYDPSKLNGLLVRGRADQFGGSAITNLGSGLEIETTAVTDDGDEQNGMGTLRLDGAASYVTYSADAVIYDALLVLKYQGLTFDNDAPLLCDPVGDITALAGDTGETKLLDLGFGDATYRYWKNSVQYLEADQQAPMDQFGLIHARWPAGLAFTDQIAIGVNFGGSEFAEIDLAEFMLFDQLNTETDMMELAEYLQTYWDI